MSERVPVLVPRSVAPSVSAESSTTTSLRARAISAMRSQSGRLPISDGTTMARVGGVVAASVWATSVVDVVGSKVEEGGTGAGGAGGGPVVADGQAGVKAFGPFGRGRRFAAR